MTLIKSISGIRGTIGGLPGGNLTPIDVVRFAAAYGQWVKRRGEGKNLKVVTGRDARLSGVMVHQLVNQTLVGMGIDVVDLGLSTTPTIAIATPMESAYGGIVITASHNSKEWNALKLLNQDGELIDAKAGEEVLVIAENETFEFETVKRLGKIMVKTDYIEKHIDAILKLPLIGVSEIQKKRFKVVVDAVNSTGGIAVPRLLETLSVETIPMYCEPTGSFPHNPEPLKEHLTELCEAVKSNNAHLGIAVDPDVDRLVFVDENGVLFGEEYTLVACADFILGKTPGNVVSNLSSTRALNDITKKHGGICFASAVGEVNVVALMKSSRAVIGGEGNGGVIYPELHYGRDALVGIAIFLSLLVERGCSVSELKATYPNYFMSKNKITLSEGMDVDALLKKNERKYLEYETTTIDGIKIDFENSWVHLRKSNTEHVVRIYTEAETQSAADQLAAQFVNELREL